MGTEMPPIVVIAAGGRAKRFSGERKVPAKIGVVAAIGYVAKACDEALGNHRPTFARTSVDDR